MASSAFMLVDDLFRPISASPEAVRILDFPNAGVNAAFLDGILTQKLRSFLPADMATLQEALLTQFQSGKRRYVCRAFVLENHWEDGPQKTRIALLFERGLPGPPASVSKQRKLAGMHEDPFGFAPNARFYCFSRAHLEVVACLRATIREGRGIAAVVGLAGIGKTALLTFLIGDLRKESDIAFLPGPFEGRGELVRAVMGAFGLNNLGRDLAGNLQHFENWLLQRKLSGRRVTLMCDDAQDLTFETLENLCLFADLQAGGQKLLQIVLAGRQGLIEKLNEPQLESVSGRIAVYSRLSPLDDAEVKSYVLHRLKIAGCTRQLFSPEALSQIALYSRGIPLNINMICRHCLSLAATVNLPVVDDRIVADSAYDLVLRSERPGAWDEPGALVTGKPSRNRNGLRLIKR